MNLCLSCENSLTILIYLVNWNCPFVPKVWFGMFSPNLYCYFFAFSCYYWVCYGEKNREPTVHARCMSRRICWIVYFLIKFCCKITCYSMNFTIFFFYNKFFFRMTPSWTFIIGLKSFCKVIIFRIWNMSKSKYFLSLRSTRKTCIVYLYNVRLFKNIFTILWWCFFSISYDLIPKYLTTYW